MSRNTRRQRSIFGYTDFSGFFSRLEMDKGGFSFDDKTQNSRDTGTARDFQEWLDNHKKILLVKRDSISRHEQYLSFSLSKLLVLPMDKFDIVMCYQYFLTTIDERVRNDSDEMIMNTIVPWVAHNYLKYILMHVINNNANDGTYLDACWAALRGAVSTATLRKAVQNSFLHSMFGSDTSYNHNNRSSKHYVDKPILADTFNLFFCYPFSNETVAEVLLWMDPADLALSIRAGLNTFAKGLLEFQQRMWERLHWFCSGQGGRLVRQKIIMAVIGESDDTVYKAGEKAPVPLADDQKRFILTAFGQAIDDCLKQSAGVKVNPATVPNQLKKTTAAIKERELIAELKYYCALLKGREEHLALYCQFALWLARIYTEGIYADAQKAQALCDDVQAVKLSNDIRLQLVPMILANSQDPVRLYLAGVHLAILAKDEDYQEVAALIQEEKPQAVTHRSSTPPRAFARRSRRKAIRAGLVVGILCAIAGAALVATGFGSPLGVALMHAGLSTAAAAITTGAVAGVTGGTIVGASLWQRHRRIKQRLQKQVDEARAQLAAYRSDGNSPVTQA